MKNRSNSHEFSVWPLMIDMLSSIFIIYIIQSTILSPDAFEKLRIQQKRRVFAQEVERMLSTQIQEGQVALESKFDYLKITFSELILFEGGEYNLNLKGRQTLRLLAALIPKKDEKSDKVYKIQVEGHTDKAQLVRNDYPRNNWELSTARALEVIDFFTKKNNCQPNLFSANGFGEFNPVDESKPSRNRRVEMKVYFSEEASKK
ncbi:MAG: flagellar motor protein MotB [Saprospiraceae bacterium]